MELVVKGLERAYHGVPIDGYKHLGIKGGCNPEIEVTVESMAEAIINTNHGLHRFMSYVANALENDEYRSDVSKVFKTLMENNIY